MPALIEMDHRLVLARARDEASDGLEKSGVGRLGESLRARAAEPVFEAELAANDLARGASPAIGSVASSFSRRPSQVAADSTKVMKGGNPPRAEVK